MKAGAAVVGAAVLLEEVLVATVVTGLDEEEEVTGAAELLELADDH